MAARKKTTRPSARAGKFGVKHSLIAFVAGAMTSVIVAVIVIGRLKGLVTDEAISQTTTFGIVIGVVLGGGVAAGVAYGLSAGLSGRLTTLSLAVSKMGRGAKASVRVSGNDEITVLGRMLSALSSEMAGQNSDAVTTSVDSDPQVRELRDKSLSDGHFECPEGYEIDAAHSTGTRGGTDYFDCHTANGVTAMYLISVGGGSAAALIAARMAQAEMSRALETGANARKALSHTNRVLHKAMPRGVCALATVVEVGSGKIKIYQAGARVPVVLCVAGELEDMAAEGLALGLDSGPVFEKGLRPNEFEMTSGMRLVLLNDAGNRSEELVEYIQEHSPKHTAPFMNMVLGALEDAAGPGGLREDIVLMTLKRS